MNRRKFLKLLGGIGGLIGIGVLPSVPVEQKMTMQVKKLGITTPEFTALAAPSPPASAAVYFFEDMIDPSRIRRG